MTPRKAFAQSRRQIGIGEVGGRFERGDDVDGRVAGPCAAGYAAGEVDHSGQVAGVGDHDYFQGFGLEMARLRSLAGVILVEQLLCNDLPSVWQ